MKLQALSFAVAALMATPAMAQDAERDSEGEIVVRGEGIEEPAAVRALVQRLADTHRADLPATRYFDALCISVSGLNTAGNDYLRDRIARNAQEIGLPVQRPGCRANALVLIHDDTSALVEQIKQDVPGLLPRERRQYVDGQIAEGAQVIVWHNEESRTQGGRPIGYQRTVAGDTTVGGSLSVETRVNNNNWPSRTELAFATGVKSAVVMLDGAIVEGMEIDRLADYATMRLLAPDLLPLEGEVPEPASVTALFPEEGGPETLTRFDRAYLSGLYAMRPNAPSTRLARLVAEAYEEE